MHGYVARMGRWELRKDFWLDILKDFIINWLWRQHAPLKRR
jgi:hypothetical protein